MVATSVIGYKSIGALVYDINEKFREIGTTTVEYVSNGSGTHYLVVHYKNNLHILQPNSLILDSRKLRLPFKELLALGQCLAKYNKTAVGVAKSGAMSRICYYEDDRTKISRTLICELVKYDLIEQEPYRTEITGIINDFINNKPVGGTLSKSKKFKKL